MHRHGYVRLGGNQRWLVAENCRIQSAGADAGLVRVPRAVTATNDSRAPTPVAQGVDQRDDDRGPAGGDPVQVARGDDRDGAVENAVVLGLLSAGSRGWPRRVYARKRP